ncbi:putative ankyrin repeat protein RF_0381 isoform X2 [Nasonia vitripennis]|nr:putative ankyrin repeat protein RF_0381 isoform X2 [Nasonia vitripennis]
MLNATTRHEKLTALHIAVKTNDRLAVEEMLNRGVRIDAQSRVGDTALHLAVKFEFKALVQLLLDRGADPNCQNDIGETPFTSSLGRVKDRMSNFMLSETAVKPVNVRLKNHAGETALHFAALRCCSVTVFKTLLNLSRLNLRNDWILLFHVIKNPNSSIRMQLFRALLKHGTDLHRFVNKDGQTLLCLAVHLGSVDVTKYLLESEKVDVNGKPGRKVPLFGALRNGNEVAVNLLLRHDARVDLIDRHVYDQSSVHAAILGFDDKAASRVCKRLLDYGAPLDHLDSNKNTALVRALRNGRERVANLLIARGANVHLKNPDGLSPLHIASNKGLIDTAKKLLDAGANVNEVTNMGSSVLEYATYSDSEEAVKLILEHGANCRTDSRALLSAVTFHQKDPQITKLLLAHGADINLKIQGKLPLVHMINNYIAYSSSSSQVLGYLLKHIALLASQGQPVQQENLELMDQYEGMKNFYEKSVRQLEVMRSTRVCQESPVTYFDLLTKRHDGLVRCLRCKKMTLAVRSNADKSTFWFYFNDMLSNYKVGLRRLSMLQKLQVLLQDVLGNQLPCELIEILCQYFNDKELEAYCVEQNKNNADAVE